MLLALFPHSTSLPSSYTARTVSHLLPSYPLSVSALVLAVRSFAVYPICPVIHWCRCTASRLFLPASNFVRVLRFIFFVYFIFLFFAFCLFASSPPLARPRLCTVRGEPLLLTLFLTRFYIYNVYVNVGSCVISINVYSRSRVLAGPSRAPDKSALHQLDRYRALKLTHGDRATDGRTRGIYRGSSKPVVDRERTGV